MTSYILSNKRTIMLIHSHIDNDGDGKTSYDDGHYHKIIDRSDDHIQEWLMDTDHSD